ncbi:hypothetical protein [Alicyclobacillus herbarius]|nr:hypothetical protein [Alicyclobacillus herbarius]
MDVEPLIDSLIESAVAAHHIDAPAAQNSAKSSASGQQQSA